MLKLILALAAFVLSSGIFFKSPVYVVSLLADMWHLRIMKDSDFI